MRLLVLTSMLALSLVASAEHRGRPHGRFGGGGDFGGHGGRGAGQVVQISVKGQGYYPDRYTADAICRYNNHYEAVGFTQWRQAGNKIQGLRSYDGRPFFQTEIWYGGMAIDMVSCLSSAQPTNINVRGQGYYPDEMTATAVCRLNGLWRTTGYTQWKQAGNKIQGQRSYDGRPFFQSEIWYGGMALDMVQCN